MTTPFGPALATYPDKGEYYAARPAVAAGWKPQKHPGDAPLGWDLVNNDEWVLVFCAPHDTFASLNPTGVGDVVAYERATGKLHVIAQNVGFPEAQRQYQA